MTQHTPGRPMNEREMRTRIEDLENQSAKLLKALRACADYLGENYVGPIEQARAAIAKAEKVTP